MTPGHIIDSVFDNDWLRLIVFSILGVLIVLALVGLVWSIFSPDNSHHFYMNCAHRLILEGKTWVQEWDCTN